MSDLTAAEVNTQIGQRLQERFEIYWLGLIFTVLGLSIQTAQFGRAIPADALELLAWLLLLVAGFAGMSRFEWITEMYRLYGLQLEQESKALQIQRFMHQGHHMVQVAGAAEPQSAEKYVADAQASGNLVKAALAPIELRQKRKYRLKRWAFVAGVCCLIAARGYVPAVGIAHAIEKSTSP